MANKVDNYRRKPPVYVGIQWNADEADKKTVTDWLDSIGYSNGTDEGQWERDDATNELVIRTPTDPVPLRVPNGNYLFLTPTGDLMHSNAETFLSEFEVL